MATLSWRTLTTAALALVIASSSFLASARPFGAAAPIVHAQSVASINHDRSTLVIGSQYGDPQNFDPIATFTLAWGMISSNIFDALVYRGPDLKIDKSKGLAYYLQLNGRGRSVKGKE